MLQLSQISPPDYRSAVKPLPVVKGDHGLHLSALAEIAKDDMGERRRVGDEWQLRGPITYIPNADVVSVCVCEGGGQRRSDTLTEIYGKP